MGYCKYGVAIGLSTVPTTRHHSNVLVDVPFITHMLDNETSKADSRV